LHRTMKLRLNRIIGIRDATINRYLRLSRR